MDTRTPISTHSPPPGNDALHSLTKAGDYSLRVDLRDGDEAVFAQYDSFQVDSADEYTTASTWKATTALQVRGGPGGGGQGRGGNGEERPSLRLPRPAQGTP